MGISNTVIEVPGASEHSVNNAKLSLMRLNMPVLYENNWGSCDSNK